ncbi:hypothetical protein FRB93_004602 [Tulasnella sp. JGI-2019a]|nr:hypothetical protein FRB93_004602 [Tulasnella sp. JGI-2019a]
MMAPISLRFMSILLVTLEICLGIAAQVTVGVHDPQLIYTPGGGVAAKIGPWNEGNPPFPDNCGGVIGTGTAGNSVTLIFNGGRFSISTAHCQWDSDQLDQHPLVGLDLTTCVPLITSSDTLTAGTHNATLVLLQELGVMLFNNFIYIPATVEPSALNSTSIAHSLVGPIVGGVLGVLVIAILAGLWFWRHKRQKREGGGDAHENTGAATHRSSLEEQEHKETSKTAQQRPFSSGSQSIVDAEHVDIEALPDQQRAVTMTTIQNPSIDSELPTRRPLPALPPSPSTMDPSHYEIIERLINQNVPRQDIAVIVRTMAVAGPSYSGVEASGDQQRAEAVWRQPLDTHIPAIGTEMPRQGQEQHPPMYDFKDGE